MKKTIFTNNGITALNFTIQKALMDPFTKDWKNHWLYMSGYALISLSSFGISLGCVAAVLPAVI